MTNPATDHGHGDACHYEFAYPMVPETMEAAKIEFKRS
jgi:hypothetical protein